MQVHPLMGTCRTPGILLCHSPPYSPEGEFSMNPERGWRPAKCSHDPALGLGQQAYGHAWHSAWPLELNSSSHACTANPLTH